MSEPFLPTVEFSPKQKAAFALAATVALPSPFPASGRIIIGIMPRPAESVPERFYVKTVESKSDKHIITQLVNLDDLRAVRLHPESGPYANLSEWTLLTREDLNDVIELAKQDLMGAVGTSRRGFEFLLFAERMADRDGEGRKHSGDGAPPERKGVIYVPETAPVLVRAEFGVAAAEAADLIIIPESCCHMNKNHGPHCDA